MTDALELAGEIASVLPEEADPRDELVALGMVATGVICSTRHEDRAELVDTFCKMLRLGVAGELHS